MAAVLLAFGTCVPATASVAPARHFGLAHKYVALGDSYTASPNTGMPVGKPVGCLRSQNNYPRLVAAALRVDEFVDASCGGASTVDLFSPQQVLAGSNAPQLDALTPDTTLVSLGIGGNDLGLVGWLQRCTNLDLTHSSCVDAYSPGDPDVLVQRIDRIGLRVNTALTEIHRRAPAARVLLVGYPVVAPVSGIGCFPQLPIDDADVAYLRDIQQRLNEVLRWDAHLQNVDYIDTYVGSIGHDPCQMDGVKWVEGLLPDVPAASWHPNELGQAATADDLLAALGIYS